MLQSGGQKKKWSTSVPSGYIATASELTKIEQWRKLGPVDYTTSTAWGVPNAS